MLYTYACVLEDCCDYSIITGSISKYHFLFSCPLLMSYLPQHCWKQAIIANQFADRTAHFSIKKNCSLELHFQRIKLNVTCIYLGFYLRMSFHEIKKLVNRKRNNKDMVIFYRVYSWSLRHPDFTQTICLLRSRPL